jgi:hypothetical protein
MSIFSDKGIVSGLISSRTNLIIGAGIFIAVLGTLVYIKILKSEVSSEKAKVTVLTNDLQISQASVKELQISINQQNAAIDKLKNDADARVAAHQAEIDIAKHTAETYKQQAQVLMRRKANTTIPKCEDANKLFDEELVK